MERPPLDIEVARGPTHCPWCRDAIAPEDEIVACGSCGARHHEECHLEHGRCAACQSTDALVRRPAASAADRPTVAARPPAASLATLPGAKITVRQDGALTHLEWDGRTRWDWVVVVVLLASCALWPLAAVFLYLRERVKAMRVSLDEGSIDLVTRWGSRRTLRRAEIDRFRLRAPPKDTGGPGLEADVGAEPVPVVTGAINSALSPAELEWLHRVLEAWRTTGARPVAPAKEPSKGKGDT